MKIISIIQSISLLVLLSACSTVSKESINDKPYYICVDDISREIWSTTITTQDKKVAEVSLKTLTKSEGVLSLNEVHRGFYNIEFTTREDGFIYISLNEIDNKYSQYKNLSCKKDQ